ncbi:unnamed protein product [Protopolystoma xenopodis]|uniref:Uncharacterized protein n=1 Tax=Protopolystoma xenopodis TaxID=117903 RepID=A0A3S5AKL0_9PLAT|nr:unnamed protein product [Protopolystoma xenopodis]
MSSPLTHPSPAVDCSQHGGSSIEPDSTVHVGTLGSPWACRLTSKWRSGKAKVRRVRICFPDNRLSLYDDLFNCSARFWRPQQNLVGTLLIPNAGHKA